MTETKCQKETSNREDLMARWRQLMSEFLNYPGRLKTDFMDAEIDKRFTRDEVAEIMKCILTQKGVS